MKHYQQTTDQVLQQLQSSPQGLSASQAAQRLQQFGANQLSEGHRKSALQIFFAQFRDLLVLILALAAGISFLSGNQESTLVIFAVILLNAILGTVQTIKAEKSLASLKAMSAPVAKVLRDGTRVEIPAAQVVPGDILFLEAGDLIAADGRILENFSLKVNESSLTGESEAVEKSVQPISHEQVPLGDQKNMVFSGSLVTYGRATVLVTATGMQTELGKIAALMNQTGQRKTPLQVSLDQFSRKLAIAILGICAIVFLLSIFRSQMPVLDALMFAVALAVAAIPEALSSIVTIVLAIGTQKMAKQHAIIKELKAVESLGAVSVICSDKTGTLTQNRMTVQKLFTDGTLFSPQSLDRSNPIHDRLLQIGLLTNDATTDAQAAIGDPTEVALVQIGDQLGIEENAYRAQFPRLQELAFDSDRKLMSTLHKIDDTFFLFTKGAIDVVLSRTDSILTASGIVPLTDAMRADILHTNTDLSDAGLRVLAFAQREWSDHTPLTLEAEQHFTFVGLVAMIDPPRPESIQAVADAKAGGIRTIMITGDHKDTATAIARQIGIFQSGDLACSGTELDALSDAQLDAKLSQISVYARVSPAHKIRIVSAWQRMGKIVSMTGDGVNDAPALKRADIGVAMGITGTEVSKDAASMILTDDNFATIVKAVVNGRSVYANIKNTIQFLLSGNMAGIFSVLFASLAALPAPFAPVHLLFINLLTDSLPAIAIGMEPARANLLHQPPRDPNTPILDRTLRKQILIQGALIALPTITLFCYGLTIGTPALAMTLAFSTLTLARLFHGFNCRGEQSIFQLGFTSNRYSLLAFVLGVLLLAAVLWIPILQPLFSIVPLSLSQVGLVLAGAFLPTLLIQLYKLIAQKS